MKKIVYILFICLIFLSGCKKEIKSSNNISLIKENIEVYSDIHLKDILNFNENVELISENYKIDTDNLGMKNLEFKYKENKKEYIYKFNINIVDTESPKVFSGTNKTVIKGYNKDICDLITYGDNYDGDIKCEIEGAYNLNSVGTYKLIYNLTDSSNNSKKVNVTLNVVEKTNSSNNQSSSSKKNFTDILAKYKSSNNEIGIDVSKWQGTIDFNKVKNAGASFVMMRIGVQKKALGELEIDSYFKENIKKAKDAGLKVGVYLYSIATSEEEAIKHANWVVETLNGESLDLPIVFDWENWSKWNSYKISFHTINSIADKFIDTISKSGYKGMLYSSKFYLENIWQNKNNNLIWLAHYTDKTSYTGKYLMWQLCNTGRIDGINGDVDIDIMYHN